MEFNNIKMKWLINMAWRDSRKNRSRLILFISSIILGIAALVAIYSLGDNLNTNIDSQAATLLGADLELSSNQLPEGKTKLLLDSIGNGYSEERSFASMVYFTKTGGNRLAQVKALEGDYPYYGKLETKPVSAGLSFRNQQAALVDQILLLQYRAQVGDSIRIGEVTFLIAGALEKAPGQNGITSTVAPAIYIPLKYLDKTGLMQKGSRITHRFFYKFDPNVDVEKLTEKFNNRFELAGLDYKTIAKQKEETGRSFSDLTKFLGLVGFVALLLGCIGVASAIHIYIREKINSIAILRCLGMKPVEAFLIYLIQILAIGILGSIVGAMLGTLIQQFFPIIIQDFLPFELVTFISWNSIGQGIFIGILISLLFALPPLLSIRKIAPLHVLRSSFEHFSSNRDPWVWFIYLVIVLFVYGFSYVQMANPITALIFTSAIVVSFGFLYAIALMIMKLVRRFFPYSWGYLWRQGLANLYRPNNQTAILIVSIGLATTLIATLYLTQDLLLTRVKLSSSDNKPNIVLFDIQTNQKEALLATAKKYNIVVNQTVPVVNMRLEEINGKAAADFMKDTTDNRSNGIFSREYRVTFRDSLTSSEKITDGKWIGIYDSKDALIPISFEKGFANRNKIVIGDTLTFNIQGSIFQTKVASFRDVNWGEVQTNFLVIFPKGILEDAPQFQVMLTHVATPAISAEFQRSVVTQFPNISIIDLALVLKILGELFTKISFVIRFMGGFSILTGIIVLISSVLISKYQRMQESVLLRTMGASKRQIFTITAMEYFFLGVMASFTGILIALVGSWGLAKFSFEAPFQPNLWPIVIIFLLITSLTVCIGLMNSRSILNKSPLEILRKEV